MNYFGKCKVCGEQKHYCFNCGSPLDEDLYYPYMGYCSKKCLEIAKDVLYETFIANLDKEEKE